MIKHIVFFTAKNPKDIDTIFTALKTLETIEGNWTIKVSRNLKIDKIANEIDVVVYGEFPDEAALDRYKDDPVYHMSTKTVRPLRDKRYAVDVKD